MKAVNYYISYSYDKITTIGNTRNYFSELTISIISGIIIIIRFKKNLSSLSNSEKY
jgi:hypothetical protein